MKRMPTAPPTCVGPAWRKTLSLVVAILLLLLLTGPTLPACGQNGGLCDLIAPSFEVLSSGASELELAQGATDTCMVQYSNPSHWAIVACLQNTDVADRAYEGHKGSLESNANFGDIGDETFIFTMEDSSLDRRKRFHLVFRRDCYLYSADVGRPEDGAFQSGVGPVEFQDMLKKARATDDSLETRGDCPQAPEGAPQTGLGVQLNCQYNYSDPGLVTCTAQATNARPDAALSYEWTVDGLAQSTGDNELRLEGVAPGEHAIAVIARDTINNETSPADRATFTKTTGDSGSAGGESAPGSGTAGEGAGGSGGAGSGSGGGQSETGSGSSGSGEGEPGPTDLGPTDTWTEKVPAGYISSSTGPSLLGPLAIGAAVLIGAGMLIGRRRRKGPPSGPSVVTGQMGSPWPPGKGLQGMPSPPPTTNPEQSASKPISPARPPDLPEVLVVGAMTGESSRKQTRKEKPPTLPEQTVAAAGKPPEQKKQEAPDLWVVAKYAGSGIGWTERVHLRGDGREFSTVTLQAFAREDGQTRDVTWEVDFSIDAGSPKIVFRQIAGPANWEIRARHIGTMPFYGQMRFGATRRVDAKVARSCTLAYEIRELRAEVRVVAAKQGFLYQEAIQTLGSSCEQVTGRVSACDPLPPAFGTWPVSAVVPGAGGTPGVQSDLLSVPSLVEKAAGYPGQAVRHAHCRASLRLDGGEWSKAAEVETDADGRFRVALPIAFTGLFTPEVGGVPLLQELELGVTREIRNELDGYHRELKEAPDAGEYAAIRDKLQRYPREFFLELCERPEADFPCLRSALNLLRISMGLVHSRRRDFGQQRMQIKLIVKETFSALLGVVLDLRWWGEKALPSLVKGLSLGFKKIRETRGLGWLASWTIEPLLKLFGALGRYMLKQLSGLLKFMADACERYMGAQSSYLRGLSQEFERKPGLTYAMVEDEAGRVRSGPDSVGDAYQLLESSIGVVFSLIGHLPLLILYVPAWLLWAVLGTLSSRTGQGVILKVTKELLSNRMKKLYDALEEWLTWTRGKLDRWPGPAGDTLESDERDAGEMLLDTVFREDEFDCEQAEALEEAYSASRELRVPEDWLAAWTQVREQRLADLEKWRKVSSAIEWGELGFDYLKYFVTKIAGAIISIEQTLASGAARVLLEAARKAMESGDESEALAGRLASDAQAKKASQLSKFTSVVDKFFDIVELVVERGAVLGLRIWEMWTSVYDAPDCIRALYSSGGRTAWK